MKKIVIFIIIILPNIAWAHRLRTSQTFMYTRPISYNKAAMNILRGAPGIEISTTYQESIHCQKTNKYFLMNCQNELSVIGDQLLTPSLASDLQRDIRAEWLGLPASFSGKLSVRPHQKQGGLLVSLSAPLKNFISWDFVNTWAIGIYLPIMWVHNNLNLIDRTISSDTPQTIAQALDQPSYAFGRMARKNMERVGASDFQIFISTTWLDHNDFYIAAYTGFNAPLMKPKKPHYIFTPTIGSNGHWALTNGLIFEFPIIADDTNNLIVFLNLENNYYLHNHQIRTFDLRHKEWSRYMLFRRVGSNDAVPGVNVLSQCVRVNPYDTFDLATGLRFIRNNLLIELGYALWAHPKERICFLKPYCGGRPFSFVNYGIAGSAPFSSASNSTISTLAAPDSSFVTIKPSDINRSSGASRGLFTNKVQVALGYWTEGESGIKLGGFYEIPNNNGALKLWGVWLDGGVRF